MPPLRVLIISDDPLARAGLATLLANQPALSIVAQIASDAEISQALDVYAPDAIAWDCGSDAESASDKIAESDAAASVLALVLADDEARVVWSANVHGILRRDASAEKIAAGLQSVAQGLTVLDPTFHSILAPARSTDSAAPIESLTPRELQVLQLLARGLANKAIAQELAISDHTVKFHVNSILAKLGAQSRTDAVVRATRLGLITLYSACHCEGAQRPKQSPDTPKIILSAKTVNIFLSAYPRSSASCLFSVYCLAAVYCSLALHNLPFLLGPS
jgi:DNA-binding NarL/FixJ family response regulator